MPCARFVLILALGCSLLVQGSESDDLLAKVAAARAHVTAVAGVAERTVVRTDPAERDGTATVRTVRFAIRAPASYDVELREVTVPKNSDFERFLSDGTTRWHIQRFDTETDVAEAPAGGPADTEFRRMIPLVRADLATLRSDFALRAEPAADGLLLTLDPITPEAKRDVLIIRIHLTAGGALKQVSRDTPDGNTETYVFGAVEDNPLIPDARFRHGDPARPAAK